MKVSKKSIIENHIKEGDILICIKNYHLDNRTKLVISGNSYKVMGLDNYHCFIYFLCENNKVDGFSYREQDGLFFTTFNFNKYLRKFKLDKINEKHNSN